MFPHAQNRAVSHTMQPSPSFPLTVTAAPLRGRWVTFFVLLHPPPLFRGLCIITPCNSNKILKACLSLKPSALSVWELCVFPCTFVILLSVRKQKATQLILEWHKHRCGCDWLNGTYFMQRLWTILFCPNWKEKWQDGISFMSQNFMSPCISCKSHSQWRLWRANLTNSQI